MLKIKNQSIGRSVGTLSVTKMWSPTCTVIVHDAPLVMLALKDYRAHRENGDNIDNPKELFPAAGFDGLNIVSSSFKDRSNCWELTCKDGHKINDFYWRKSQTRGYPDKADGDRYWFSVHYRPSGTKIEGFSARITEHGWLSTSFYIQYDECGPIQQWMEAKDLNYLRRIRIENTGLFEKELAELKRVNPQHPAIKALQQEPSPIPEPSPTPVPIPPPSPIPDPLPGHLVLNYQDVRLQELIASGGFGEIYRAKWLSAAIDVAVKKLILGKLSPALEASFKQEAAFMVQLQHPNIVRLFGIVLAPEQALVMEFMADGSLFDLLHSDKHLSWQLRYQITTHIATGLFYLHGKKFLHRDLKSMNVLLQGNPPLAKLADFGLTEIKLTSMTHASHPQPGAPSQRPQGTTHWMAPEIFGLNPSYSFASDIYAFAMVVWEIMSRQLPYKDVKDLNQVIFAVSAGQRANIPAEAPAVLKDITAACWAQAPEKRPLTGQILQWLSAQPVTDTQLIPSPHKGKGAAAKKEGANIMGMWATPKTPTPPSSYSSASSNSSGSGSYSSRQAQTNVEGIVVEKLSENEFKVIISYPKLRLSAQQRNDLQATLRGNDGMEAFGYIQSSLKIEKGLVTELSFEDEDSANILVEELKNNIAQWKSSSAPSSFSSNSSTSSGLPSGFISQF